jgi:hypothetical protein
MSSDVHSILVGELWRKAGMVAKASGSAITGGTVNYYLKCLTGTNAGKWYKNSDQTWAVAETANAMTHQADGSWTITLTEIGGSNIFLDGVLYLEYAKESGDLHVAGEGRLLRGKAILDAVNMTYINGTSIAGTSTYVAAAFVAQYNVASPVFTNASVNQTADVVTQVPHPITMGQIAGAGVWYVVTPDMEQV